MQHLFQDNNIIYLMQILKNVGIAHLSKIFQFSKKSRFIKKRQDKISFISYYEYLKNWLFMSSICLYLYLDKH